METSRRGERDTLSALEPSKKGARVYSRGRVGGGSVRVETSRGDFRLCLCGVFLLMFARRGGNRHMFSFRIMFIFRRGGGNFSERISPRDTPLKKLFHSSIAN